MDFRAELQALVDQIPRGKVATVSSVAKALGDVRASRAVVQYLLRTKPRDWWKIVHVDGSFLDKSQRKLLEQGRRATRIRFTRASDYFNDFKTTRPLAKLRAYQKRMASKVVLKDRLDKMETLAGIDIAYRGDEAFCALAVVDADTLRPLELMVEEVTTDFPYIPGYLAFREMPAIRAALKQFPSRPSVLFVDGNGRLHPARFGLACMVGVEFGLRTIGIAKSLLIGEVVCGRGKRFTRPVILEGEHVAFEYRKPGHRPIYVSQGNKLSLRTALAITRKATRSRLPEPLRLADLESRRAAR